MSTSRRPALKNNPNAANSPFRTAGTKQKRSFANVQREEAYGQPPPAKRVMTETRHDPLKTPPRAPSQGLTPDVRFSKRSNPVAFRAQLVAARASNTSQPNQRIDKTDAESLESVRNWQKHYRQAFPNFVFYFESIPEESRTKVLKQIAQLNAREEKFFSNAATHVITTRPIPNPKAASPQKRSQHDRPQTIDPVLLDRSSESTHVQAETKSLEGRLAFEGQTTGRKLGGTQEADHRRHHARNADVLHRAQELGIKIWPFEKLQRILKTMFDVDTGAQLHNYNTRNNSIHGGILVNSRLRAAADLSQLLRNERRNGPSDRDQSVATKELTIFKGPFIYIHDMDEKQRPIMFREYQKVAVKEDGAWPQFRSVTSGRCPFVEEVDYSQRDAEKEALREQRRQERERAREDIAAAPRTRAAAAEAARMQPPKIKPSNRALLELADGNNRRKVSVSAQETKRSHLDEGTDLGTLDVEPFSKIPQNAFVSHAPPGRLFAGEPVASGVQPSITSAIRSQVVSSTAAAPGTKAGMSKEVFGLQRKVLEKNSAPPSHASNQRLTTSHRMVDIAAAAREETAANVRLAKRKAQEKLGGIPEHEPQVKEGEVLRRTEAVRESKAVQKREIEKRDPKTGYCENCQDKFEDFEEHCQSRKHRKFAEKNDNWKELDSLLHELARPRKY